MTSNTTSSITPTDELDTLTLTGLEVFAHHGVFDFERANGQIFLLDLVVWLDTAGAAAGDDLEQTLHYGELAIEVAEAVASEPVDLIETLAERVASLVLAHAVARRVRVTVHKPDAPIPVPFADVSITITRPRDVRTVAVLAFGSNLGARGETIYDALADVDRIAGVSVLSASSLYETAAVKLHGVDLDAPRYINAVAMVGTSLPPRALLAAVNDIEQNHGRVRDERWGDRTLDIDIITYGELQQSDEALILPHPRAWQRDFVLAPWLEIDPEAVLPGHGRVDALLAATENAARPLNVESL